LLLSKITESARDSRRHYEQVPDSCAFGSVLLRPGFLCCHPALLLKVTVLANESPDNGRVRMELRASRPNMSVAGLANAIDIEMTKDRILTKNRRNSVIFCGIRTRIGAFESTRRPANLEPTDWRGSDSDHAKCRLMSHQRLDDDQATDRTYDDHRH
jgi:hypothetical protein